MNKTLLLSAALTLALGTAAAVADTVIASADSSAGKILVDGAGMSLYTFDNDKAAVSNCYDDCAVNWPPLEPVAGSTPQGDFGIILRSDNSQQWTYKGQPLYLWVNDAAPGDVTGNGIKDVWHLARP